MLNESATSNSNVEAFTRVIQQGVRKDFPIGVSQWKLGNVKVLTQNVNKPGSRFAKLARKHDVRWLIYLDKDKWVLFVDGKEVDKAKVSQEGELLP